MYLKPYPTRIFPDFKGSYYLHFFFFTLNVEQKRVKNKFERSPNVPAVATGWLFEFIIKLCFRQTEIYFEKYFNRFFYRLIGITDDDRGFDFVTTDISCLRFCSEEHR